MLIHDPLGSGRKRKASGYEYMRSRQEDVEGQLHEETRVNGGLLVLLEQGGEARSERTGRAVDAYEGGGTRA